MLPRTIDCLAGRGRRAGLAAAVLSVSLGAGAGTAAAANLPKTPTELSATAGTQIRPQIIGFTGDGTGYLGGFTGRSAVPAPSRVSLRWAGRLHWTEYNSHLGRATGAEWLNNGRPDDARGTFHPYKASVRVFDPRGGVFRKMTVTSQGHSYTLTAMYFRGLDGAPGYWQW